MKTIRVLIVIAAATAAVPAFIHNASSAGEALRASGGWGSDSTTLIRGTWEATLNRNGEQIRGHLTLKGSNVFTGGYVTGKIDESIISLGVLSGEREQARFEGTIDGDLIKGEWSCEALKDRGSWYGGIH